MKKKISSVHFKSPPSIEKDYQRKLIGVAKEIERILSLGGDAYLVKKQLALYKTMLQPWAEQVATSLVTRVDGRNWKQWRILAKAMGLEIEKELRTSAIGVTIQQKIRENVKYITALPDDASEKLNEWLEKSITEGWRADEIARRLKDIGNMTIKRATLIARTEVSRTSTALTHARAQFIASPGYIWRTEEDASVRPSHAAMEGRFVLWDEPPTLEGMTGHAGEFPNCRCYPEVVVPED